MAKPKTTVGAGTRARLGDTLSFSYTAFIHDKTPQIFFLARVGKLVHGMNQHYQSPQEKTYFFYVLKSLYYNKILTGQLSAYDFYHKWIKGRLKSDSYRTYRADKMQSVSVVQFPAAAPMVRQVDINLTNKPYDKYTKGDKVRYISMVKNKLAWVDGEVLGRGGPPGYRYAVQAKDGTIVHRHPADLKRMP
jgi:hypothetical protein